MLITGGKCVPVNFLTPGLQAFMRSDTEGKKASFLLTDGFLYSLSTFITSHATFRFSYKTTCKQLLVTCKNGWQNRQTTSQPLLKMFG